MENRMMKAVKNMAVGAAVGAMAVTAGAMYMSENKSVQKTMNNMKRTGKKIAMAGQNAVDDMMK
ncbi:MAG: hypothetical protein IKU54_03200 [Oscillospiraceae bacterium]|nr:hypothetical protein [Oscillospiraceae bacterium]